MVECTRAHPGGPGAARSGASRRALGRVLQLAITVGLLALLAYLADAPKLASTLASANPWLLAAAAACAALDRLLMAAKWYPLLRIQDRSISFGRALHAYLVACFTGFFLPATVGPDLVRALALGLEGRRVPEIGASIAAERVIGATAAGAMVLISLLTAMRLGAPVRAFLPFALALLVAAVAAMVLPLVLRPQAPVSECLRALLDSAPGRVVHRLLAAYRTYRRHPAILACTGALSLLEQCFPVLALWIVSRALGTSIELGMLLAAVPLVNLLDRLPISISGIGPSDVALVYALRWFGVPGHESVALVVCARLVELTTAVPGAFLWPQLARMLRAERIVQSSGELSPQTEHPLRAV